MGVNILITSFGVVPIVFLPHHDGPEMSLSTKVANESTTSSGGLSVLDSSPGLYFPVFTKHRDDDQSPEGWKVLMD